MVLPLRSWAYIFDRRTIKNRWLHRLGVHFNGRLGISDARCFKSYRTSAFGTCPGSTATGSSSSLPGGKSFSFPQATYCRSGTSRDKKQAWATTAERTCRESRVVARIRRADARMECLLRICYMGMRVCTLFCATSEGSSSEAARGECWFSSKANERQVQQLQLQSPPPLQPPPRQGGTGGCQMHFR